MIDPSRKSSVISCAGLLLSLSLAAPGALANKDNPNRCDITVTGMQTSPSDAGAVHLAVNGPHVAPVVTVCLSGDFDFGSTGFVAIDPASSDPTLPVQELRIVGLSDATIHGGWQPLQFRETSALPRLSISGLRFEDPTVSAISIFRGNEAIDISDVEIDGVIGDEIIAGGITAVVREGIAFSTAFAKIAGEVRVEKNAIDGGSYDPVADRTVVNAGIGLFGAFNPINGFPFSATVVVSNNVLTNWSGSGIAVIDLADARIELNRIEPGAFADLPPAGPGVCARATGLGRAAGMSFAGFIDSTVINNTIVLEQAFDGNGQPACNAGFILLGNNGVQTSDSTGNTFAGNIVGGSGTYAFVVGLDSSNFETDNTFLGNNVSTFSPDGAHLFLGTGAYDNTFKGSFPAVDGNVAGNSIRDR